MPAPDLTGRIYRRLLLEALDETVPDNDEIIQAGETAMAFGRAFTEKMFRFATSTMSEEELADLDIEGLIEIATESAHDGIAEMTGTLRPLGDVLTRPPD